METHPNQLINFIPDNEDSPCARPGLTKREYFAIMALQGLLASGTSLGNVRTDSEDAVDYADKLIEVLNGE